MTTAKSILSKNWDHKLGLLFAFILHFFLSDPIHMSALSCKEGIQLMICIIEVSCYNLPFWLLHVIGKRVKACWEAGSAIKFLKIFKIFFGKTAKLLCDSSNNDLPFKSKTSGEGSKFRRFGRSQVAIIMLWHWASIRLEPGDSLTSNRSHKLHLTFLSMA